MSSTSGSSRKASSSAASRVSLALSAALLLAAGGVGAQEAEGLVVLNNDLALGEMFADARTTNAFVLSNASAAAVEITAVRPTCGCTFAKAERETLPPGGKTRIVFGFHAGTQAGIERRSILVMTSAGQLRLFFHAKVVPMFAVESDLVDFGTYPSDPDKRKRLVRTVEVVPHRSCREVRVGKIGYDASVLEVQAEYLPKARKVVVTLAADLRKWRGEFLSTPVTVSLDCDGNERTVVLNVLAVRRD